MKEFDIWAEPYLASGMEGIPSLPLLVARNVKSDTFEEACDFICKEPEIYKSWGEYDPVRRRLWGCKLHPSYEEAEASWAELRKRNREL